MAFNWQTFRTRSLTAAVFVAVMLTGLLWNRLSFFILFTIIHFGCWWEYLNLTEKICSSVVDKAVKTFISICGFFVFLTIGFSNYSYDFLLTIAGIKLSLKWGIIILALTGLVFFLLQNKNVKQKHKWFLSTGFVYISLSLGLMMNMRFEDNSIINSEGGDYFKSDKGMIIPLLIIFSIWINDTMAYIVGSLIGKTPLSKISPKKTWEGTIGGIIMAVCIISYFFQPVLYWKYLLGVSLITSVTGTFGDLFESKLKRMAGVKDSGSIMPGHGGFLDRFDSLLFAIPFVWVFIFLILK